MTRFARAKGSKASNERVPDEATPWHVMKEQLEDNILMKNNRTPKAKSAKELLTEKDEPFYYDSTGNVNNEWAEFKREKKSLEKPRTIEKKPKSLEITKNTEKTNNSTDKNEKSEILPKSKKNKRKSSIVDETAKNCEKIAKKQKREEIETKNVEDSEPKSKKKVSVDVPQGPEEKTENSDISVAPAKSLKISKRHKRNQKRISKNALSNAEAAKPENGNSKGFNAAGNDWSSDVKFGRENNKSAKLPGKNRPQPPAANGMMRKAPKTRDDKQHKRRKPDSGSVKCVINGMEVEIVKYDGFPVKKEDAERLKDLRQKMIMKAIPKSEIDAAIKLERRKAEKALARVRKQVCFHCRKAGHNLSDCPELGEGESATGICFKCGSTEHTHFECKVNKKEEFRFASCFICREQGHIAKQCPDNPKGLYPQGGSCKICGDVTHLRKDCPDLTKEKEETTITIGTIAENTLEAIGDDPTNTIKSEESKKPKSKIVKF